MPRTNVVPDAMLRLVAVIALAFSIGACRDSQTPAQASANANGQEALYSEFKNRVDAILALSDERTEPAMVTLPTGETVEALRPSPRKIEFARTSYEPPEEMYAETPGERVAAFSLGDLPTEVLVDEKGTVVVAWPDRVERFEPDGTSSMLLEESVTTTQWNSMGTELLLAGPSGKRVLSWPDGNEIWNAENRDLEGYLVFEPEGNAFWLLRDRVDFNAASQVRILWEVFRVPRLPGNPVPLVSVPPELALVGTLPTGGMAWGHEFQFYRILPDPAPLVEVSRELKTVRQLTHPGESVDIRPSMDQRNRMVFIRAPRRISSEEGISLPPSARAWMADLGDADSPEWLLTAEPTVHAAISPGGKFVVLAVVREGEGALLRTQTDLLIERDLGPQRQARLEFEKKAREALEELRSLFAQTEEGKTEFEGEYGKEIRMQPSLETVRGMAKSLKSILAGRFPMTMGDGAEYLGALDDFLTEADGLWPEEPATIYAVAGIYGEALEHEGGCEWLMQAASTSLGSQLTTSTETYDEYLLRLHSPFYVARERLAGRASLHDSAVEALASSYLPLWLTENLEPDNIGQAAGIELGRCGISPDASPSVENMSGVAADYPENELANRLVYSFAERADVPALGVLAALNLAASHPEMAQPLLYAADSLEMAGDSTQAIRLYEQAMRLAPDDLDVLISAGDGYLDAGEIDRAEEILQRAREMDEVGIASEYFEETFEAIKLIREDEESTP